MSKKQTLGINSAGTYNAIHQLCPVAISDIEIPQNKVHKNYDKKKLSELAARIKKNNQMQPVLLAPLSDNTDTKYRLVAGERRLCAAIEAGLSEVPAYIRPRSNGA